MNAVMLNLKALPLSDEQFYTLCQGNQDKQLEMTAAGELVIMSPVGGESGRQEADLITDVNIWNRAAGLGYVFSSSTIFKLPDGAKRSPDVAWVEASRWEALEPEQRLKFPPIAPDFVIELRSPSDGLTQLQEKMKEYLLNGVRLGWLVNPKDRQVEIYRLGLDIEIQTLPFRVSGEAVLPGFQLFMK